MFRLFKRRVRVRTHSHVCPACRQVWTHDNYSCGWDGLSFTELCPKCSEIALENMVQFTQWGELR